MKIIKLSEVNLHHIIGRVILENLNNLFIEKYQFIYKKAKAKISMITTRKIQKKNSLSKRYIFF
jgi:hypothetical protein